MKFILQFTFLLITCFLLNAQEIEITGMVRDGDDKMLMAGVTVVNKNTGEKTLTDFDGKYRLNVSIGDELLFSFIGYVPQISEYTGQDYMNESLNPDKNYKLDASINNCGGRRIKAAPHITYQYAIIRFY